jgi:hypothetical protein
VVSEGLELADGSIIKVEALICATGFDNSFRPPFPVRGYEADLRDLWEKEPTAYFSVAAAGIPNYFGKCA